MNVTENRTFKNFTGNTARFNLKGGRYGIVFTAAGSGSAALNAVGPDFSTLVPTETNITATSNYQMVDLAPGQYVFVTSGFTAANVSITSIPT